MTQKMWCFLVSLGIAGTYLGILAIFTAQFFQFDPAAKQDHTLKEWSDAWQTAMIYSIDTMTCRGRCSDPKKDMKPVSDKVRLAAWESIIGHLFLPLAIGALFAAFAPSRP